MTPSESHRAWQNSTHAELFDAWANLPLSALRKTYESFNEIRLLVQHESHLKGRHFLELGCATGELYRYLRYRHPQFQYVGFDISKVAIERAGQKYPAGRFFVCGIDLDQIQNHQPRPDILFARDVVHHQPCPLEFLGKLLAIPREAVFLRIRTRDQGKSVLDPDQSCQWNYQHWAPYMVLNTDEVIATISQIKIVEKICIYKHYQVLGGRHNRFLPKECYDPATGTAETAVYVKFSKEHRDSPQIVVQAVPDARPEYSWMDNLLSRLKPAMNTKCKPSVGKA